MKKKNTRASIAKPKSKAKPNIKLNSKPKKATTKRVAKKAVPKKTGRKTGSKPKKAEYEVGNKKPPVDTMFKPGVSGNPNGRPKGKLNFDTRVDLAVEALAIQMAIVHNKKKENKNNQIKQEDLDIEGDIFMQLVNKARAGNEKMIDSFLDRRHGKATARIELTGKDGDPIAYEERKKEAKSKARKMLDAWTKNK